MEFPGHVLDCNEVGPTDCKLKAVRYWPILTSRKNLQAFLGFVNYYRRFIPHLARIAQPLNDLLKADTRFNWTPNCQQASEDLRLALVKGPSVKICDPSLETRIETDASGHALGAVLSQQHSDGWQPVAFLSRTMTKPERNYPIQDQEPLVLVFALRKWRHYLFGTEITAYTDHPSLGTWETNRDLSGRKSSWTELLSEFSVEIVYRKGQDNIVAD